MSIVVAAVAGLLVGVVVGALGAGILTLPILVYVLDFAPHSAAMASLVIVGATSLVSLLPHARRGNIQWAQGVVFGVLGTAGAVAGARLAALVDAALLMVLFAGLLLLVAALMLRRTAVSRNSGPAMRPMPLTVRLPQGRTDPSPTTHTAREQACSPSCWDRLSDC